MRPNYGGGYYGEEPAIEYADDYAHEELVGEVLDDGAAELGEYDEQPAELGEYEEQPAELGEYDDQPVEGVIDAMFDPLGITKLPGKAVNAVNSWVDKKAATAAGMAQAGVTAGIRNAIGEAGRTAGFVALGGVLVGAVVGGVYYYRSRKKKKGGAR